MDKEFLVGVIVMVLIIALFVGGAIKNSESTRNNHLTQNKLCLQHNLTFDPNKERCVKPTTSDS